LAKSFNLQAFIYLVIYNLIFVLPLVIISILVYHGTHLTNILDWKESKKKWMRLATGIVMVALGVFLIYYYIVGIHI